MIATTRKGAIAGAPVLQDKLGGSIQLRVDGVNVSMAMIKAGRVKGLAFLGRQRHTLLATLPTGIEQGMPNLIVDGWRDFVAPVRMPPTVMDRLGASLRRAVQHPDVQAAFTAQGTIGHFQDRATMARLIREELARWRPIVTELGIRLD
jgi:tripartite-type tricarboxylate transporter receptor subunit TctC